MLIGNVDRSPADPVSSRAHVDTTAWCVRVALLLLVSPALLLVLIVGGLFVLAQAASRVWLNYRNRSAAIVRLGRQTSQAESLAAEPVPVR